MFITRFGAKLQNATDLSILFIFIFVITTSICSVPAAVIWSQISL